MKPLSGACLCGEVSFDVTPPTKWCANCHCTMCRRAHGAAFVTWVGVSIDQFRLAHGETSLIRYRSSAAATRSFCRRCGSTLFFESTRWAGEVHVVRANFHGAIDRPVQAEVFYSDRCNWWPATDELPKRGGPTGTDPIG